MGRRISTATAVSEVWDSHQATLHRPCCVQKAGSKTGVAMKSQNPSKSAGGLKQCPFCIQSEMMILRYLKSPTPFLVDWELSAMRPKKTPGFRRWIWWDLWRPLPGDPFGFDQLALVLLQDIDLSVFTVLLYLNCITVGPGIGRYLILLHESTHCCGIKPNRCGQTNPSCWLYLDGCWQNSELTKWEALHRCHIPLVIMFRYFSIFFDIFQVLESSRMKARRQSITESETSKQSNQECPLEVQSRKLIQTSDWFLQHLPHGASTSLLKFMYHGLEKLSFFLLLVFINMFSWTCRNLE